MRVSLTAGVMLAVACAVAHAAPPARPVVVELFTSEGCSSCPPADQVLTGLARDRPDILPLAMHVNYWNGLGWRDPFSFAGATERQRRYVPISGQGGIYTPQAVIDGRFDAIGSDRAAVLRAVAAAAGGPAVPISVARTGAGLAVTIAAGSGEGRAWLIGYDSRHRTPVGRGENAGRTLIESNIVRSLVDIGPWSGAATVLMAPRPSGEHLAVIVQAPGGPILGAARVGPPAD
ncbi:MAG: DUF1223 domain-containing protein [Rhodospirillales bacterium]|nr:DUF1223 domain-containing protein [Rhodospirillales bacterium]